MSELSLQLVNSEGKGVAKLTLDTGMIDSMRSLSAGGVGAVPSSMTAVDWYACGSATVYVWVCVYLRCAFEYD